MLRKLIAAACFAMLAFAAVPSHAQPVKVVATCGVVSPAFSTTLTSGLITMDVNGNLCTAASVSASITGFPTVQSTGTPISVTTSSATGTLPAGAVVVASNVGATNGAYCKLGASATVSDQLIPPNSWFAFTVGANTQLSCITSTSTTTVNMVGGSGLPTGSGGGGGGGGSSAITTWAGSTLGAISAYGTSPGAVTVPAFNAFVTNTLAAGQAVMASSSPVVIASNQSAVASSIDPCNDALTVKSFLPITATTSLVKVIATGTAAKKLYICQINLVTTAANNVAVFEATTATTCATAPVAVYGAGTSVATAANGYPFAANGGISLGNGLGTVGFTTVNNNDLCIGTSAATPLTGGIIYATK